MEEEFEEVECDYLPIGSVVLLKEATKKVMITGYASVSPDTGDKVYDYSGCMFPEGFVDYDEVFVFDNDQIQEVCQTGYTDDECMEFMQRLETELNKLKENE